MCASMYVCERERVYVHACVPMYICAHDCVCMCVCACACACVYVCVCVRVRARMCASIVPGLATVLQHSAQ